MPVFDPDPALAARDRLVTIAQSDTGQSRRVAKFLLAGWNAGDCRGLSPTDLWLLDRAIADDVLLVTRLIAVRHEYPTAHGYAPHLADRPVAGRA